MNRLSFPRNEQVTHNLRCHNLTYMHPKKTKFRSHLILRTQSYDLIAKHSVQSWKNIGKTPFQLVTGTVHSPRVTERGYLLIREPWITKQQNCLPQYTRASLGKGHHNTQGSDQELQITMNKEYNDVKIYARLADQTRNAILCQSSFVCGRCVLYTVFQFTVGNKPVTVTTNK